MAEGFQNDEENLEPGLDNSKGYVVDGGLAAEQVDTCRQ